MDPDSLTAQRLDTSTLSTMRCNPANIGVFADWRIIYRTCCPPFMYSQQVEVQL